MHNNKTNLGFNENIKLPNIDKVQFTYTAVYIHHLYLSKAKLH